MIRCCPTHPDKDATYRDGNGGYECRLCHDTKGREAARQIKQQARPLGDCLCGGAVVASPMTPNGKIKLCRDCLREEQRQQEGWVEARFYGVTA